MRNPILPIFLIMTLAACATQEPRPDQDLGVAQARVAPAEPLSHGDEAAGDLMYQLLVGEIAGQMGALDISVNHYLQAARSSQDPAVAERAARVSLFAERRPQALEASRRWVELAPESPEARQVLGALLVHAGEVPEALEHLQWVVTHTPQGEAAGYGVVSNLLSRSQNREAALAAMQGLAERNPEASGMQLALARLALQLQRPDVAIAAADRALVLDPSQSEAHVLRARGLVQAGELERGLQGLREAVAASPDDSELRMAFGRLLIQAESYDEARAEFERLIERRPGDADLLYTLGLLSIEVERYEDARSYLTRLLETGRRSNDANFYLGRIAEIEGDREEALRHYRGVGDGDHFREARLRKALLLGRAGEGAAALEMLRELRRDADEPQWRMRLYVTESQVLRDQQAYEEAMELLNQGLVEQPDSSELLYARALVAERLDRLDIMEIDLRAVLEMDPDNAAALNALGYTLADRTDRLDEAYDYISRAHAQHPDDAAILDSMGWVLYRMGRLAEAETYLRRAYEQMYDPEIASNLASLLWDQGQRQEARGVLDNALEQDPDHERLLRVKERFEQ